MNRHREQGRDLQQYAIRLFGPDDFARVCVLEEGENGAPYPCLLYTSDAADE